MSKDAITWQIDRRKLDSLIRTSPGKADELCGQAAYALQADVQTNFNEQSPAPAGEPPGVVTGNLTGSLKVVPIRQALWEMRVGATYGPFLEFGTPRMAARPFLRPAVWRLSKRFGKIFEVIAK